MDDLRLQIALRYAGMGVPQPLDQIVITNGATEAINLCLMAVTKPGDAIAIESPCFYAVLDVAKRLRLRPVEIPVDPHYGLDLGVLAQVLERQAVSACWFMTNFHNPTGVTLLDEKKRALLQLLSRYQVPLIEDDVYGELYFGPHRPLPAKAYDVENLVMHCSSMSKTLAPGYRLGWVAAGQFADEVRRLKSVTSGATSLPIQAAMAEYLENGGFDKHLRKLRASLQSQLAAMTNAIRAWLPRDVVFESPGGGYFIWLRMPLGLNTAQIFTMAVRQGISLSPGQIFSLRGEYHHYLRLNFGYPWNPRFESAMQTLGELLDASLQSHRPRSGRHIALSSAQVSFH
jgi:DNA-binding transcriptional MocR family regulator